MLVYGIIDYYNVIGKRTYEPMECYMSPLDQFREALLNRDVSIRFKSRLQSAGRAAKSLAVNQDVTGFG